MPGNPILLCAPQSDLRDRLERELIASGYPVSSVDSPAEAVAALRDARFDLVVADGLAVTGALGLDPQRLHDPDAVPRGRARWRRGGPDRLP